MAHWQCQIDVRGPVHDLHSGLYGGTVHNPAQALVEILGALHHSEGSVAVPGFYDKVRQLDDDERASLAQLPYTLEDWRRETGAPKPWGEADYSLVERITVRPTLEINGIYGGFSGEGRKMVIPAHAGAKISMRLVADQDPVEIADLTAKYLEELAPESVEVQVTKMAGAPAVIVERDTPQMRAAVQAYEAVFGVKPVFTREGSSITAVGIFQQTLGVPTILMNLGLRDDGYHGPNERLRIDLFYKGIQTLIHYYRALGQQSQ